MSEPTFQQLTLEFVLQICIQSLCILPSAFLCFYTVEKEKLLYSPQRLTLTILSATLLYAVIYFFLWLWIDLDNAILLIPFFVLSFLYYRRSTTENTYLLLFIFLCSVFYGNLNMTLFLLIRGWLFMPSEFIIEHDLWEPLDVLCLTGVIFVTLPGAIWLMGKKLKPVFDKVRGYESLLLWFLPTAFIILLAVNVTKNIFAARGSFFSFLAIIMVISTLQSVAIMHQTRNNSQKKEKLRQIDVQLKSQKERFAELLEYNKQVRFLRHDMRHHLLLLERMLSSGKYEEAEKYLKEYSAIVEPVKVSPLCANYVVDVIARHYMAKATSMGIKTDFVLSLPQNCGVLDSDLCIVVGNLLENAVRACSTSPEDSFIRMRTKVKGNEVLIAVDNSCCETDNVSKGSGLGIPSVQAVAHHYDGIAKMERKNNVFEASVLLTKKRVSIE